MSIPLDPGRGGRSIGADSLRIADIIVSTTSALVSAAIRMGTNSEVSHAALYIGGDQVVEAIRAGVVLRDIETSLSDDILAVVYRVPGLTATQGLRVRDYVGRNLGLPYSIRGAVGAGLSYQNRHPYTGGFACAKAGICMAEPSTPLYRADRVDSFFCSQLVFAAFQDAGIPLAGGRAQDIAPADIPDLWLTRVLLYVGHLKG